MVDVDRSDLLKIADVVHRAAQFHANRDHMNQALHLATEVRYSPLTSELLATQDRLAALLTVPEGSTST